MQKIQILSSEMKKTVSKEILKNISLLTKTMFTMFNTVLPPYCLLVCFVISFFSVSNHEGSMLLESNAILFSFTFE